MIVRLSIENWMSFRDRTTFSMVASREKQHGDRLPKIAKYQTRILPIAAIYGGNASGKSNFFKALSFAQKLVVKGTQPDSLIAVEPFRLSTEQTGLPSKFEFELLIDGNIYDFSFAVTRNAVIEEKLILITSSSEKILYDRCGNTPINNSLANQSFLEFAFKGTRSNQLFLTNSVSQNIDAFRPIYNWFKDNLELIAPDSRFEQFEDFLDEDQPLYDTMNEMLQQLDTGIAHLGSEDIPFERALFPEPLKLKLQEEVKENMTVRITNEPIGESFLVTRKNGNLTVKKLVTYHEKADGTEVKFDIYNESDGSKRIIDLLPAFLEMSTANSNKVFIVDEIDRSLHSLLIRQLLKYYLEKCSAQSRSQLLLTTHDIQLMDQKLLRRDEMWATERENTGNSKLFSFSEYEDIRYDKDIRKSYLQGRLGGIPKIIS